MVGEDLPSVVGWLQQRAALQPHALSACSVTVCAVCLQAVQGCRHGPPLGGKGLVKRCGFASVLPGVSQPPDRWASPELFDTSGPRTSPQHHQEVPSGQLAAGHWTAAVTSFWQGGKWEILTAVSIMMGDKLKERKSQQGVAVRCWGLDTRGWKVLDF